VPRNILFYSAMSKRKQISFAVAAALITVAVLQPVLNGNFVNWDDPVNLLSNPDFRGLGWAQLKWMFTTFHMGHYQPISWLTLGLDYVLWGMNPFGYRLSNLLLHALNAVWVFVVARQLLGLALPRAKAADGAWASLVVALLFSVHPLRVESVAWATERRDVLSAFFYLAAIWAYLRSVAAPAAKRLGWQRGALMLFAASLLSKAQGVHLPIVLWIINIYPLRRKGFWPELVPYFALSIIFGVVAIKGGSSYGRLLTLEEFGPIQRIAQLCFGFVFYIVKSVYPVTLSPLYARPEPLSPADGPFLFSMILTLIMTTLSVLLRRQRPALLAAWAAYVLMLIPVSGAFPNGPQIAADRYTYLACLPWPLLLAGAWLGLRRPWLRHGGAILAVTLLCMYGYLTRRYIPIWADSTALWERAYAVSPYSTLAQINLSGTHYNKGVDFVSKGNAREATLAYRRALTVYPASYSAHYNLGNLLLREGDAKTAIFHYQWVLRISPGHTGAMAALKRANAIMAESP
jgi:tetratricopeptide (TPR) repeat protein